MKKYNVIYADPPWSYNSKGSGRCMKHGAKNNYSLMSIDDIGGMPLNNIVDDNALLFMWATVPLLTEAMSVIPRWGFEYRTLIVWEKTGGMGMGFWLRVQVEILLIGVRGKVKPFSHQEKNIYKHAICGHSAKPHFFRELVSKLAAKSFGDNVNRLELFARSREGMFSDYEYEGWDVYGNQVNNSIKL